MKPIEQCCQADCNKPSTHSGAWPGHPTSGWCDEHADKALKIANAMGFPLYLTRQCDENGVMKPHNEWRV